MQDPPTPTPDKAPQIRASSHPMERDSAPEKKEAQTQHKQTGLGSGNQQKGRRGCKSWPHPSPAMQPVLGNLFSGAAGASGKTTSLRAERRVDAQGGPPSLPTRGPWSANRAEYRVHAAMATIQEMTRGGASSKTVGLDTHTRQRLNAQLSGRGTALEERDATRRDNEKRCVVPGWIWESVSDVL